MSSSLLEDLFSSLERDFRKSPSHFMFSTDNIPSSPPELSIDNLIIKTGTHGYSSYTTKFVDMLLWSTTKSVYRHIAYLMLSKIFHRKPNLISVSLTNPSSDVKTIIFDYCQDTPWNVIEGYEKRPYQWRYRETPIHNPPQRTIEDRFLPRLSLSDPKQLSGLGDPHPVPRDRVRAAGSDYGSVIFAQYLLDFAQEHSTRTGLQLECEYGHHTLGQGSAEVSLWLPGGLGWQEL